MAVYSSQRYLLVLVLSAFTLLLSSEPKQSSKSFLVEATKVQWQGNDKVSPQHEKAHYAPRSQKYWDEHGIERPEYAMTDAEIIAKRRQQDGSGDGDGRRRRHRLVPIVAALFAVLLAVFYANVTGDWDTILNIPSLLADRMRWMLTESGGISGHRLGSSTKTTANLSTQGMSDEESRRLARLARFDNPKNILDDMKMD